MMSKAPKLSDQLRIVRREIAQFRHGGVMLTSEDAEGFVRRLDEIIADARNLEARGGFTGWDRNRAAEDRQRLMTPSSVIILDAFRKDPKVVPFPKPRPHPPTGRA
jgi:hypothetical protein